MLLSFSQSAVLGEQVYGPYGTSRYLAGSISTPKGYTGQIHDAVTGLDYYNARYYDPVVGMFLSIDTVQGNQQGMDPYAYVRGNPETMSDPTGNDWWNPFTWGPGVMGAVLQVTTTVVDIINPLMGLGSALDMTAYALSPGHHTLGGFAAAQVKGAAIPGALMTLGVMLGICGIGVITCAPEVTLITFILGVVGAGAIAELGSTIGSAIDKLYNSPSSPDTNDSGSMFGVPLASTPVDADSSTMHTISLAEARKNEQKAISTGNTHRGTNGKT